MRIMISGGTGFIGSNLARGLSVEGHEIALLGRKGSKLKYFLNRLSTMELFQCSEISDFDSALNQFHPDGIIHLGASTREPASCAEQEDFLSANLAWGTKLLYATCRSEVRFFINAESYWQFNSEGQPRANGWYASLKQAFSCLVDNVCPLSSIRTVHLVLHDVYGEGDQRGKLLPTVMQLRGGDKIDLTPGKQVLDFIHVDDVVSAFIHAANQVDSLARPPENRYFIGHQRMQLKAALELYREVSGLDIDLNYGAKAYAPGTLMIPCEGRALPGWEPTIELRTWFNEMKKAKQDRVL